MVRSGGAQTVGDTVGTNAGIKSDIVINRHGKSVQEWGRLEVAIAMKHHLLSLFSE